MMKNKATSVGLKNIGRRLLAHPVYLWVSAVCAVLYVAATLYTPKLTGQAVDLIVGDGLTHAKILADSSAEYPASLFCDSYGIT